MAKVSILALVSLFFVFNFGCAKGCAKQPPGRLSGLTFYVECWDGKVEGRHLSMPLTARDYEKALIKEGAKITSKEKADYIFTATAMISSDCIAGACSDRCPYRGLELTAVPKDKSIHPSHFSTYADQRGLKGSEWGNINCEAYMSTFEGIVQEINKNMKH